MISIYGTLLGNLHDAVSLVFFYKSIEGKNVRATSWSRHIRSIPQLLLKYGWFFVDFSYNECILEYAQQIDRLSLTCKFSYFYWSDLIFANSSLICYFSKFFFESIRGFLCLQFLMILTCARISFTDVLQPLAHIADEHSS